jgi:hypothetical protein
MNSDPKMLAAAQWYGYGRWDAPYWFVGKEPGGTDDPEQYASWARLGKPELLDCRAHDLDCASTAAPAMWHGDLPRLQPTWRPLIAMVLAYEGAMEYDAAAARQYQDERWGRSDGDTAVLELSAIAAKAVSYAEELRLSYLEERISLLRARLKEHEPKFVVLYGLGDDPVRGVPYLEHWRAIAQYDLMVDEPVRLGTTVFVVQKHPTAHGTTTQHWAELAARVRALSNLQ